MKNITEEDFYQQFELQTNHIQRMVRDDSIADEDICGWEGKFYDTFGHEGQYVREMADQNRVITILDENDEDTAPPIILLSGYHPNDAWGFLITKEPIPFTFKTQIF